MSTWFGFWHGGSGYAVGDPVDHLEQFHSLEDARQKFVDRYERGGVWRQSFEYVNNAPMNVFTPIVGNDCIMWLWSEDAATESNEHVTVPDYPDRVLSIGPRGGVRMERA